MSALKGLSSDQLLAQLIELVRRGRNLEADLIAHLAEVDERRLYLREGCSSMFAYCVEVLRFAEAVAYKRIAALRAARRYPELLTALRRGDLHLTAVSLLAPQLTGENVTALLAAARHRTADEIRRMLADRRPKPDVVSSVRRLSVSPDWGDSTPGSASSVHCGSPSHCASTVGCVSSIRSASSARAVNRVDRCPIEAGIQKTALGDENGRPATPPAQPANLPGAIAHSSKPTRPSGAAVHSFRPPEPLGDERYLIRFTADREFHAEIQELRSLMRHQVPDGDVGKILAKAVGVLLKQVRARKFGTCSTPRLARSERIVRTEPAKRNGPAERVGPDERIGSAEQAGPAEPAEPAERAGPADEPDRPNEPGRPNEPDRLNQPNPLNEPNRPPHLLLQDGFRSRFAARFRREMASAARSYRQAVVAVALAIFWSFTIASRGPGIDRIR